MVETQTHRGNVVAATGSATAVVPQRMSAPTRVIGAIINPRATFQDIGLRPGWRLPLLIMIVLNVSMTAVFGQREGWRTYIERVDQQNPMAQQMMAQMTPEEREQRVERQLKVAPTGVYLENLLSAVITLLVCAGFFAAIFNLTANAALDFRTSFGIVVHSYLPFSIYFLVGMLVLFVKPRGTADLENLVASNIGAFLKSSSSESLRRICSSLDIFTVWFLGLMALGYSAARPRKLKIGKVSKWVFGVWLIYVVIRNALYAAVA